MNPTVLFVAVLISLVTLALLRTTGSKRLLADGGYIEGVETTTREKPAGILRWITTVDHADIGLLYLILATVTGLWGGIDAMMMRTELVTPEATVWTAETYNALFTVHGTTMLFFFATPVFTGLANYFIPPLVGADDMAFPRVNAIAFWLLPPSLFLVRAGLITEVIAKVITPLGLPTRALFAIEPPAIGWTMYTPLSRAATNPEVDLFLLGLHLSGIATVLAASNIIVTIFTERDSSVNWANLDIFSWTMLTASGLIIFAFPMLGSAMIMLLLDRNFGTFFYSLEAGGAALWQHLFWFFGHPEVYILVLPAFGIVSYVLPKFTGRKLFGFKFVVYSTLAIGVLSFGVWAHHMFTTGMDPRLKASFMAVSLAIAVPSAVKTFNWITTIYNGKIRLTAPMIFCVGGISTFIVGGVTGVFLASIPIDLLLHDTYYVVGHFHLILVGIIVFAMFAASYFWYPILTGRMFNQRLARAHAWVSIVGTFLTFSPMLLLGMMGLPRRYAAYPAEFAPLQQVSTVGALILFAGVGMWLWNMIQSYRVGAVVTDADVWDLRETGQFSREWEWFERKLSRK
ncbi:MULTISPECIES: cbb3-type cytochrome c oxidase subunit I [unclassified Haladaptatus]|uniref:cbb3-type cytochrome c oxidase subunit I n=1 Tax=unclassified Haladaptatus TaxID=2622732 RepID=UPI0023E8F4C1|nr:MULTISPECIES: cbb3-type cytochrome c oxidase subunit I [unclassified Haladaptatus]